MITKEHRKSGKRFAVQTASGVVYADTIGAIPGIAGMTGAEICTDWDGFQATLADWLAVHKRRAAPPRSDSSHVKFAKLDPSAVKFKRPSRKWKYTVRCTYRVNGEVHMYREQFAKTADHRFYDVCRDKTAAERYKTVELWCGNRLLESVSL